MAKQRMSTAERQAALFGQLPKPAPVMTVPPPNNLPTTAAATPESDAPDFEQFLKMPDRPPAPPAPPARQASQPEGIRYFGFRSRHTSHGPWTVAPGRWTTTAQAAKYAKAAKELDARLEVQIFPVV